MIDIIHSFTIVESRLSSSDRKQVIHSLLDRLISTSDLYCFSRLKVIIQIQKRNPHQPPIMNHRKRKNLRHFMRVVIRQVVKLVDETGENHHRTFKINQSRIVVSHQLVLIRVPNIYHPRANERSKVIKQCHQNIKDTRRNLRAVTAMNR